MKNNIKQILLSLAILFSANLFAQTLIINEVSNGASGAAEYIELVVMDNTVLYNCADTEPPCVNIQGWIIDDNSGYHSLGSGSGQGVAGGCIRFSFDPLWSCVPVGTIILLYNNSDFDATIMPTPDLTMADGNCRIVAPIDNTTLFEKNTTTPGDVACDYPATGWVAGGQWTYIGMRNDGDCARIVDLGGCEVFSLCWGDNDQNTVIYFTEGIDVGSGDAANTVFYFNGGDPSNQANWTVGCADVSDCGVQDQTPGTANNFDNDAYISQFNNGCQPIEPMVANAVVDQDAFCGCTGMATASGTGSIPGYTYEWLDGSDNPIGQTGVTATNLCAGDYRVVVTSSVGCDDTSEVITLVVDNNLSVSVNSLDACEGDIVTLTATPTATGGTFLWSPGGENTQSITIPASTTGTYDVDYTLGICNETASGIITVFTEPVSSFGVTPDSQYAPSNVVFDNNSTGATDFIWDFGNGNTQPSATTASVSDTYTAPGSYNVILTANNGPCIDSSTYILVVLEQSEPIIEVPNIFTPNDDATNDLYTISTFAVQSIEGVIINRWGNVMYEFSDVNFAWDGTVNGTDADEGTYFIKYKAIGVNEKTYEGHTFLQLVRD